jgi:hypothetical protein
VIARIRYLLPFRFFVPADFAGEPLTSAVDGWQIILLPPVQSQILCDALQKPAPFSLQAMTPAAHPVVISDVTINGADTIPVDLVEVQLKQDINPVAVTAEVDAWLVHQGRALLNRWLTTYRVVVGATHVKPLPELGQSWRIDFLDDSGNALGVKTNPKPHGSVAGKVDAVASLVPNFWKASAVLALSQVPTRWEELLVDAFEVWPNVGAAVVLAYTAIETRIDAAVSVLAISQSVDKRLWEWLAEKRPYLTQPTTEEKAKFLFQLFTGDSLSDDKSNWKTFSQMRKARNSFAHEGVARTLDGAVLMPERCPRPIGPRTTTVRLVGVPPSYREQTARRAPGPNHDSNRK